MHVLVQQQGLLENSKGPTLSLLLLPRRYVEFCTNPLEFLLWFRKVAASGDSQRNSRRSKA